MSKIDNLGDNANTNGFKENPDNINKKGRGISIRQTLRELLEKKGEFFIPKEQIINITDDGVTILIPDDVKLALTLTNWAVSKKGYDSLKAIQLIIEHIDGKPNQAIQIDPGNDGIITVFKIPDNERDSNPGN